MPRRSTAALLAFAFALAGAPPAAGQATICRPALAFRDVAFSAMRPPTLERRWSAVVTVDTARCASDRGAFEIAFTREKENAPDLEFSERFTWTAPAVTVAVDFWSDEAVAAYWFGAIAPCPCAAPATSTSATR
jgi:hypothetical protein